MLILIGTKEGYKTKEVNHIKCFTVWNTLFFIRYEKKTNQFIISSAGTGKMLYNSINQNIDLVIKNYKKFLKENFTKEQFLERTKEAKKSYLRDTKFDYPLNSKELCPKANGS